MGLTLQLSSIPHLLASLFYRLMSQPPSYVPGLFGSEYRVETRAWHDILRDNASLCMLKRLEFCKAKDEKLHEFLILYFSHPTHAVAHAVAIVDRAVKDRARPSAIMSPSSPFFPPTEALDRVHVMDQGDSLESYLSSTYGPYDKLCILKYTPAESAPSSLAPQAPSAMQLSTLLLVTSNHRPDYTLYEYNCYWYADTVFEACKTLFKGCREECRKHSERGKCKLKVPILATHTLLDICNEYNAEWAEVMQRQRARELVTQQASTL